MRGVLAVTSGGSLFESADFFAGIQRQLGALDDENAALRALTALAVQHVPGCELAGITRGRKGSFSSVAETSERVCAVDEIQYALGSGPCVDASMRASVFNASDLRTDARWPTFGRQAFEAAGVVSMLSFRLFLEEHDETVAALNMYASYPSAFGEDSEAVGLVLATAGALTVSAAAARAQARNLRRALENSREIGIAIGVLMNQHKLSRDQSMDMLRIVSQRDNRKLADIAAELAETGALPEPARRNRPAQPG